VLDLTVQRAITKVPVLDLTVQRTITKALSSTTAFLNTFPGNIFNYPSIWGRDSVLDIATRYELDGPGIESRLGRNISYPSRPALGPNQPPVQWVPGLSRG
jgi:hypothetical protein